MLSYLVALFALLSTYNTFRFYLIRRRINKVAQPPILPGAEPIVLDRPTDKVALLIHGFTSTPKEMSYLAAYLAGHGIAAHVPLLPGHGTTPEHLALVTYPEWVRFVHNHIIELEQRYRSIYLIGNSFGGNLALLNAESSRAIRGVVTISTPMYFHGDKFFKSILPILRRIKIFKHKKYSTPEYEQLVKTRSRSYTMLPLRALSQVVRATNLSAKALSNLDTPLLVVQSEIDKVAHPFSGQYIFDRARTNDKSLYLTKESGHGIVYDDRHNQEMYDRVLAFIQSH